MPKSTAQKITKGLGARYGSTVRKRTSKVLAALKQVRQCPSCGSKRFKRASVGLWSCNKCGYVVAGGAYEP
jgi:large subunit ribosomal protein L37Ae